MLKLPDTIKVGGFNFKVYFPYNFDNINMGGDELGLFEPATLRIKVRGYDNGGTAYPNSTVIQSLFHEILHAIDLVYCYDRIDDLDLSFFNREDMGEISIPSLSLGWYQVLKDNKIMTLKTIPKKVKIGAYTYDVVFPYDKKGEDALHIHGVQYEKKLIKIRDIHSHGLKYDIQRIKQILLYCISLIIIDNYACWIDPQEDLFTLFSYGLYQVLVDNNLEELIHKYK